MFVLECSHSCLSWAGLPSAAFPFALPTHGMRPLPRPTKPSSSIPLTDNPPHDTTLPAINGVLGHVSYASIPCCSNTRLLCHERAGAARGTTLHTVCPAPCPSLHEPAWRVIHARPGCAFSIYAKITRQGITAQKIWRSWQERVHTAPSWQLQLSCLPAPGSAQALARLNVKLLH